MAKKRRLAKDDTVQVRVAASVKADWEAAAARERRLLSDWLRLAAEDRAQKSMDLPRSTK